jgi:RNase H-fold protein (predicted Holliday junction resolvase)
MYTGDTEEVEIEQLGEAPLAMQIDDPAEDPLTLSVIIALWPQVLEKVKKKSRILHSLLTEGVQAKLYEPGRVVLGFRFNIHKEQIEKRENRLIVEQVLEEQFKEKMQVYCQIDEEVKQSHLAREKVSES